MPERDPIERLHGATRAAMAAARTVFGAPSNAIDLALAGLDGVAPRAGARHETPDLVRRHLVARPIAHPEAGALQAALIAAADRLIWGKAFYPDDGHPDIPHFREGYAFTMSVGDPRWAKDALTTSNEIGVSYTVQAPDTLYPDHAHTAVELYYVIAGKALWKRGGEPWVERYPGEIILHETGMRHAMATGSEPLVACAMWISHTNAPSVVVRA